MKKITALLLTLAILVTFSACGSGNNDGDSTNDPVELKLNTSVSAGSTWVDGANRFAELNEERTEGRYTIKVFTDAQLASGSQPDSITMHQSGDIDISLMGCLVWANADTRFCMPCMPWLFSDWDAVRASLGDGMPGAEALATIVEDCGAHSIGVGANGFRQLFTTGKQVTSLEELTGLKIRIPGNSLYIDLWKELGADPVSMSISELYTALQQGAVEAQENPYDSTVTSGVAEVTDYGTEWNYSYEPIILSVSDKVWNTLSDEDKVIFAECGAEAMEYQVGVAEDKNAEFKDQCINEYGIEVVELTDDQIAAFKDAAQTIYENYKDIMGSDLYEAFGVE